MNNFLLRRHLPHTDITHTQITKVEKLQDKPNIRRAVREVVNRASPTMVDDAFSDIANDMHIIVCGSPRVGKSTIVNAICGKQVAVSREGFASVTQTITPYTMEGEVNTGLKIVRYKYTFWDTPGFESWDKNDIKSKVKEIIDKPEKKPLCMIFCASPSTFVEPEQLNWLLNLCINKRHIFCALVCTKKYGGQPKDCDAVLKAFNALLSKYANNEAPRVENDISFYGNIGLCAAVNSEPYVSVNNQVLPPCGVNELIHGIMSSLVDEEVINWCMLVLENQGFWEGFGEKMNGFSGKLKGKVKSAFKELLTGKKNKKVKTKPSTFYVASNDQ